MPLQIITDKTIPGYTVDGERKQWTSDDGDVIEINANRKLTLPGWKFGRNVTFRTTGRREGTTFRNAEITDFEAPEGLSFVNCDNPTLANGIVQKQKLLDALPEVGTVGIDIYSSTSANAPTVQNVIVNGFHVGVCLFGDIEGGILDNLRLVGNHTSVQVHYVDAQPGLQIIGGHSSSAGPALALGSPRNMLAHMYIDRWLVHFNKEYYFNLRDGVYASVNKPNRFKSASSPIVNYEALSNAGLAPPSLHNVVRYTLAAAPEEQWQRDWYDALDGTGEGAGE